MLEHLDDPLTAGLEMVRFELQMLVELGFGLDLASCAATGAENDLGYVSPKSAARCRASPRHPGTTGCSACGVLVGGGHAVARRHRRWICADRFFLARHVLEPRGLAFADAREGFVCRSPGAAASGARGAVRTPPGSDPSAAVSD
jgi:DNA repair protein RecO (recombination protein O)